MSHRNPVWYTGPDRLRIFVAVITGSRVAGMTDTKVALKPRHIPFIKNITDKTNAFFCMKTIITGNYSRRILPSVLKLYQAFI